MRQEKKNALFTRQDKEGELFEQNKKKVCSLQEHPGSVCTASSGARSFTKIYPLSNKKVLPHLEVKKK